MIDVGPPPSEGWPVMVWFHGGDFNTGTPAIWDATVFVNKQKVRYICFYLYVYVYFFFFLVFILYKMNLYSIHRLLLYENCFVTLRD